MTRLNFGPIHGSGLARLLACAGVTALLHLLVLTELTPLAEAAGPAASPKPLTVRTLPADASAVRPTVPAMGSPRVGPSSTATRSASAAKPPAVRAATRRQQTPPTQAPVTLLAAETPAASAIDGPASMPLPAREAQEPEDHIPTYSTRIPPSFSYRYDMSRGPITGLGSLTWSHEDSSYRLRLAGEVPVIGSLLTQESVGGFDAHGLAPERFTDRRRSRAAQAANFQREAGKITFSGPATEHPLRAGTQDRLSWMVQLAAIAEADPAVVAAGRKVSFYVIGVRGEASVWTLVSSGPQEVSLVGHAIEAVKLVREPRKPHDTLVEVWLDPGRHYLPVRARLSESGGGEALELVLQEGN